MNLELDLHESDSIRPTCSPIYLMFGDRTRCQHPTLEPNSHPTKQRQVSGCQSFVIQPPLHRDYSLSSLRYPNLNDSVFGIIFSFTWRLFLFLYFLGLLFLSCFLFLILFFSSNRSISSISLTSHQWLNRNQVILCPSLFIPFLFKLW